MKPGRNDPCICGSGKKYKHCCASLSQAGTSGQATAKAPTADEQNHLIALYKAGRYAELENQATLLLKRYPDSGFGWKILSGALMAQRKDALHALQQTAKFLPQDAEVLNNLGDALAKSEQLAEAEQCLSNAIRLAPSYADAYYNLGQVLNRQNRHIDAEQHLRIAIQLNPHDADAYNSLGVALLGQERFVEAETSLRHTLKLAPYSHQALTNLGLLFRAQQKHKEAIASYRQALKIKPDFSIANSALGIELQEQGNFAEAEPLFRRARDSDSSNFAPIWGLVNAKKIQPNDEDFNLLRRTDSLFKNEGKLLSADNAIFLHFALGKCHHDTGDYAQAFRHYLEGNRLKRTTFNYDSTWDTRMIDEIINAFSTERIQQLRGSGHPTQHPIFIVGMPRSGTTLTEQIIASHPEVHGAGELPDLLTITQRNVANCRFPASLRLLDQSQLQAWGTEYAASLQRHAPQAQRITDKMPYNFIAVGLIHLMLPNAKIIHVNRNPMDTSLSCFFQLFGGKSVKFSYDLTELSQFFVNYHRLMEHWRKLLPTGTFLEVQYEDLVLDTETEVRRLLEYCELPWNQACLNFHENKNAVHTASLVQVRQPIYRSSLEQWRRYEKYLGPLLETLGDLVPNR